MNEMRTNGAWRWMSMTGTGWARQTNRQKEVTVFRGVSMLLFLPFYAAVAFLWSGSAFSDDLTFGWPVLAVALFFVSVFGAVSILVGSIALGRQVRSRHWDAMVVSGITFAGIVTLWDVAVGNLVLSYGIHWFLLNGVLDAAAMVAATAAGIRAGQRWSVPAMETNLT